MAYGQAYRQPAGSAGLKSVKPGYPGLEAVKPGFTGLQNRPWVCIPYCTVMHASTCKNW